MTIGITVYTWVDLLKEYLQTAIASEELRQALPPGFARCGGLKPILHEKLTAALDRLRSDNNLDRLIDAFRERVRGSQPPRPLPFKADVMVIDLESTLKPPPHGSYSLTEEGEKTMLEFKGIRYQLPEPVALTIRATGSQPMFRASKLADHMDAESRLALIRHLADIEFLSVTQSSNS